MGNHQSYLSINQKKIVKSAGNRVGSKTLDTLLDDWNRVAGNKKTQITFEKFCELMQHLPKDDLRKLFDLYDTDHNNKVSFEEYVLTVVVLMDGSLDEKLTLIYNSFDTNRDGSITRQEFQAAAKRFSQAGTELDREMFIRKVFSKCDTNNDGTISFEEFRTFLKTDRESFEKICGILAVGLSDE